MTNLSELLKKTTFIAVALSFLLSLTVFAYSANYYYNYNESNVKMIDDFKAKYQEKNSESEFNELCSEIRPANFSKVYHNLMNWSELALKISATMIFIYFIYGIIKKEKISYKGVVILLFILILSFLMFFFSLDTDYDILYCLFGFSPF